HRWAGTSPVYLPRSSASLKLAGNSATWRPPRALESTIFGMSAAEIGLEAKAQKYRLRPDNPGIRLRRSAVSTSAVHPPSGADCHWRRIAFGGVRKTLVSTGRR